MRLGPTRTNFETTIIKGINHTKFVYCRQDTFKMGVHSTKKVELLKTVVPIFHFSIDTSLSRNDNFPWFFLV